MRITRKAFGAATAATLALGALVGVSPAAQAGEASSSEPYIRMMDWNRYDILMESKTHAIATDPGQAAWACKEVIGGATAAFGLAGPVAAAIAGIAASSMCVSAVTVCAAQASTAGKWGGMTFTVLPPNFW